MQKSTGSVLLNLWLVYIKTKKNLKPKSETAWKFYLQLIKQRWWLDTENVEKQEAAKKIIAKI